MPSEHGTRHTVRFRIALVTVLLCGVSVFGGDVVHALSESTVASAVSSHRHHPPVIVLDGTLQSGSTLIIRVEGIGPLADGETAPVFAIRMNGWAGMMGELEWMDGEWVGRYEIPADQAGSTLQVVVLTGADMATASATIL